MTILQEYRRGRLNGAGKVEMTYFKQFALDRQSIINTRLPPP